MKDRERKVVISRDAITVVDDAPKRGVRGNPTRPGLAVPDPDAEYEKEMLARRTEEIARLVGR